VKGDSVFVGEVILCHIRIIFWLDVAVKAQDMNADDYYGNMQH